MSPCSSDCIFRAFSALSGVQSLRILGSYQLAPPDLPKSTAAVHRQRDLEELTETGERQVLTESHLSDVVGELAKVRLFRREQRDAFKEWNDAIQKRLALANYEHQRSVALAIRLDVATAEPVANQLEHLSPVAVLADMKLRNELKSDTARAVALHRDREAPFSVDVPCDVAVQPFLLIVRTRHVVTIVNARSDEHDE